MGSQSWWSHRIEEKAYRRLQQLREKSLWTGAVPVPVDHVIEHLLGLSIVWEVIPEDPDEQILACLRPEKGQVVLNERHVELFRDKPGLERFSKGHEAGHADVFALVGETDQLKLFADSCYRPRRRSAPGGDVSVLRNRLRGLDPETRIEVMRELVQDERRRQAAGDDSPLERSAVEHYAAVLLMPEPLVRELARQGDLAGWPFHYQLAEAFGVTISAMIVRLKELGLVFDVVDRAIVVENPAFRSQGKLF
jgi:hypothetical protein